MTKILPVILAGGSGQRLWPLSRAMRPKQFLNLIDSNSLFQNTLSRLKGLNTLPPLIICNEEHRFLVAEQLRELNVSADIILEPEGRNTAPAIALAALKVSEIDNSDNSDPILLVLAADHLVEDVAAFEVAIIEASYLAAQGKLVTFGITANRPETGYGYIRRGAPVESIECRVTRGKLEERGARSGEREKHTSQAITAFAVDRFVEKPNQEKAQEYLDSGDYYWNSGMFMFKASRYLEALEIYSPEILEPCRQCIKSAKKDLDFIRIDEQIFSQCSSNSIDYAVMEPLSSAASNGAEPVVVVPLDAGWSDIGSWSAIWDAREKDKQGNCFVGDVIAEDSTNCFVHAGDKLVSLLGLQDMVVVDTKDALLVASKEKAQEVKNIVERLKKPDRNEWKVHREVYRPWGKYDAIDIGSRYQVKRITVNSGAKLSVQMHHHRAEHWVVVSGTAKVTNGEKIFLVSENESTYIPIGQIHALENPGKEPLELIEIQTGSYLGEDDIVRLKDNYGRDGDSVN